MQNECVTESYLLVPMFQASRVWQCCSFARKSLRELLSKTLKGQLKLHWGPYNVNDAESERVIKEPGGFESS